MTRDQNAPDETLLGPFGVRIDSERLKALNAAAGLPSGEAENIVYPIFWLTRPEIKAAAQAIAGPEYLPIHESQAFECFSALRVDAPYELLVKLRRESKPERLILVGEAFDDQKRRVLSLRAVLRLFAIPASMRPAPEANH